MGGLGLGTCKFQPKVWCVSLSIPIWKCCWLHIEKWKIYLVSCC